MTVGAETAIHDFPGDRSEARWLDAFEFLRARLSEATYTDVRLGCYRIDDVPEYAGASGCARIRGQAPIPDVESDCWEGVLCWSGNRGERGYCDAFFFPFSNSSALFDGNGELEFIDYKYRDGRFESLGCMAQDEFGEWAQVTEPGTVYWQRVETALSSPVVNVGSPIRLDVSTPGLSRLRAKPDEAKRRPRISLVHVNRGRECTNLAPWTARPPGPDSRDVLGIDDCEFPSSDTLRIRLDRFRIRGGWIPGDYHLSIRVQNFGDDWTWSADISRPFRLTILG